MTTPNIPEEAIEAAALASYIADGRSTVEEWRVEAPEYRDVFLRDAAVQAKAAAPFIAAQAWDEGREVGAAEYWDSHSPNNPYRKESR